MRINRAGNFIILPGLGSNETIKQSYCKQNRKEKKTKKNNNDGDITYNKISDLLKPYITNVHKQI